MGFFCIGTWHLLTRLNMLPKIHFPVSQAFVIFNVTHNHIALLYREHLTRPILSLIIQKTILLSMSVPFYSIVCEAINKYLLISIIFMNNYYKDLFTCVCTQKKSIYSGIGIRFLLCVDILCVRLSFCYAQNTSKISFFITLTDCLWKATWKAGPN